MIAPEYDTDTGLVTNSVFSLSGRISGEGEVVITNDVAPDGGNTEVEVEKKWNNNILASDKIPVEVTLMNGAENSGSIVNPPASQQNPVTLSTDNSWKYSWTGLPGDTNYYIEETENGFIPSIEYTYTYTLNEDLRK